MTMTRKIHGQTRRVGDEWTIRGTTYRAVAGDGANAGRVVYAVVTVRYLLTDMPVGSTRTICGERVTRMHDDLWTIRGGSYALYYTALRLQGLEASAAPGTPLTSPGA